jgi:anti-sigma factor RsiW
VDHCDPALPAALALGRASAEDARAAGRHLERCAACREEVETLRGPADTARRTAPADSVSVRPPPRVWDAVAAGAAAERRDGGHSGTGDGPE